MPRMCHILQPFLAEDFPRSFFPQKFRCRMAMVMEVEVKMSMMDTIVVKGREMNTTTTGNSPPKYILICVGLGMQL